MLSFVKVVSEYHRQLNPQLITLDPLNLFAMREKSINVMFRSLMEKNTRKELIYFDSMEY